MVPPAGPDTEELLVHVAVHLVLLIFPVFFLTRVFKKEPLGKRLANFSLALGLFALVTPERDLLAGAEFQYVATLLGFARLAMSLVGMGLAITALCLSNPDGRRPWIRAILGFCCCVLHGLVAISLVGSPFMGSEPHEPWPFTPPAGPKSGFTFHFPNHNWQAASKRERFDYCFTHKTRPFGCSVTLLEGSDRQHAALIERQKALISPAESLKPLKTETLKTPGGLEYTLTTGIHRGEEGKTPHCLAMATFRNSKTRQTVSLLLDGNVRFWSETMKNREEAIFFEQARAVADSFEFTEKRGQEPEKGGSD